MPRLEISVRTMPKAVAVATVALLLATTAACGPGGSDTASSPAPVSSIEPATSALPPTLPPPTSPTSPTASALPVPVPPPVPRTATAKSTPPAMVASPTKRAGTGTAAGTGTTGSDSPGRHDGSNYDNLSPAGREAHDTENCAQTAGKKKGSCNEPHRKCREAGATVTSSAGVALTCRTYAKDGRLHWLAAGE
ncbi:hypothetical protein [Kitasatospora sp. NPDC056273]|uniref:hypothetical protein n=1 Tax=Kitasatospora sp. NPDC056273 TaxID=3345769 RepID=UPI0035DE0288